MNSCLFHRGDSTFSVRKVSRRLLWVLTVKKSWPRKKPLNIICSDCNRWGTPPPVHGNSHHPAVVVRQRQSPSFLSNLLLCLPPREQPRGTSSSALWQPMTQTAMRMLGYLLPRGKTPSKGCLSPPMFLSTRTLVCYSHCAPSTMSSFEIFKCRWGQATVGTHHSAATYHWAYLCWTERQRARNPVSCPLPCDGSTGVELAPFCRARMPGDQGGGSGRDSGQNAWLALPPAEGQQAGLFSVGLHTGEGAHGAGPARQGPAIKQSLVVAVRTRPAPSLCHRHVHRWLWLTASPTSWLMQSSLDSPASPEDSGLTLYPGGGWPLGLLCLPRLCHCPYWPWAEALACRVCSRLPAAEVGACRRSPLWARAGSGFPADLFAEVSLTGTQGGVTWYSAAKLCGHAHQSGKLWEASLCVSDDSRFPIEDTPFVPVSSTFSLL